MIDAKDIHRRWADRIRYTPIDGEFQCYGCKFHIKLSGSLGSDWGVCANVESPYDGYVMFEHAGCTAHVNSDGEPS